MNVLLVENNQRDQSANFEHLLEQLGPLIEHEAKRALQGIVLRDVLDLEIDDVVQRVRIKLWLTLQQRAIYSPKAYVRRMVHTEVLQLLRSRRSSTLPLPLDEDGEIFQGNFLSTSTLAEDPAEQVEQIDRATYWLEWVLDAIAQLPPRQYNAMLMSLKERIDDVLVLVKACYARDIELDRFNWPHENHEDSARLRVSVSIARKKLREKLQSLP